MSPGDWRERRLRGRDRALQIGLLTEADLLNITRLERSSFELFWGFEEFRRCLHEADCHSIVAKWDGRVAGFMICRVRGDRAQILNAVVCPLVRRVGIGAAMLTYVLDHCRICHVKTLVAAPRKSNHTGFFFFRSQGFEPHTSDNTALEGKKGRYILRREIPQAVSGTPLGTHVRWMIRRDMEEVLRIEEANFEFPWLEEDFVRYLRQRNCIGMVAQHDERVVGFMIYELHKMRLQILNFAVAADCFRRGVGRQMLAKLVGKLSSQRRNRISLEVHETNLAAQLFFQACGFRAVSVLRGYYEDTPEDAYLMQYRVELTRVSVRRNAYSVG